MDISVLVAPGGLAALRAGLWGGVIGAILAQCGLTTVTVGDWFAGAADECGGASCPGRNKRNTAEQVLITATAQNHAKIKPTRVRLVYRRALQSYRTRI